MTDRIVLIDRTKPQQVTVGATALTQALCELRNAWRDDNAVFSVRVMRAVGAVITETEAVFDFEDGEESDQP